MILKILINDLQYQEWGKNMFDGLEKLIEVLNISKNMDMAQLAH
jgi:hypothetical protein